jgi:hypothetical protein
LDFGMTIICKRAGGIRLIVLVEGDFDLGDSLFRPSS